MTQPLHTVHLPLRDTSSICTDLASYILANLSVEDCGQGIDDSLAMSTQPLGSGSEPTDGESLQHLSMAVYSPTVAVLGSGMRGRQDSVQGLRVQSSIILAISYRYRPGDQLFDYRQAQRLMCRIPSVVLNIDNWASGEAEIPLDSLRLRLDQIPGLDEYLLISAEFDVYHQIEV